MVSVTPKLFRGHGTGVPPLEPSQQIPARHHPSKSTEKQDTDPKVGQAFWGGADTHVLTWIKSSQEEGDALDRRDLGAAGAMPPSHVPTDGQGVEPASPRGTAFCPGVLPRKTPCRDIIANKPNKRGFSHHLYLALSDV